MEPTKSDVNHEETMKEVMDLIEEARFYWTDQGAGITMDLLPGTIGVLLLLGAIWFIMNVGPSLVSSMGSALSGVVGGYGHHLSRHSNKYGGGGGGSAYDDYDYSIYPAAAEHYEAQEEAKDIMRSASNLQPDTEAGASFYSGSFVKPGGHLVQRQVNRISYV